MTMQPRHYTLNAQTKDATLEREGKRMIARRVVMTSEDRDRAGDVVRMDGADLAAFLKNPVVLFGHNQSGVPVAKVLEIRRGLSDTGADALVADLEFADTELGREVFTLWEGGFLRAVSIGFLPKQEDGAYRVIDASGEPVRDDYDPMYLPMGYGVEFLKWELLELSIVPVPANREALQQLQASEVICKALGSRPRLSSVDLDRVLAEVSIEACSCGAAVGYDRSRGKAIRHGKCAGKVDKPSGMLLSEFVSLIGETGMHDADEAREALISRGVIRLDLGVAVSQLQTRAGAVERAVEKEGRVLSARNRALITEAVGAMEAASSALGKLLEDSDKKSTRATVAASDAEELARAALPALKALASALE